MINKIVLLIVVLIFIQQLVFCQKAELQIHPSIENYIAFSRLKTDYNFQGSMKLKQFPNYMGFNRYVVVFKGKFPLPIPVDSTWVIKNSKIIASYFADVYYLTNKHCTLEESDKQLGGMPLFSTIEKYQTTNCDFYNCHRFNLHCFSLP